MYITLHFYFIYTHFLKVYFCQTHTKPCNNETTKIFLNTKGTLPDVDAGMLEFLSYVENTTDAFAAQATRPLIKVIHKRVTEEKQNKDMEIEYMTLLQRDREILN